VRNSRKVPFGEVKMSHLPKLTRMTLRSISNVYQTSAIACCQNRLPSSLLKTCGETQNPILSNISQNALCNNKLIFRSFASKNDQDIADFLGDEIAAEKGNLTKADLPGGGFEVKTEGAEVTFTKQVGAEKIVVSMNVNHTVDSAEPDDGSEEAPEMKSRPNFEVDIVKTGGKTLSFSCSFTPPPDPADPQAGSSEEAFDDVFAIEEVTMFEGENWTEKTYAVSGDILDGYLYDLFMNMLDERGINKEFAEKMSDYCSAYEHSQYIQMLEDLQKFVK